MKTQRVGHVRTQGLQQQWDCIVFISRQEGADKTCLSSALQSQKTTSAYLQVGRYWSRADMRR